MSNTLTAARLKVTVVLNPNELLGIAAPDAAPRAVLRVQLPDRTVTADVAAKSLRARRRPRSARPAPMASP